MGQALATTIPTSRADAAEDLWSDMAMNWHTDGVWGNRFDRFQVFVDGTGVQAKVRAGACNIAGFYGRNTSQVTVALNTPDSSNPRIDTIVLRLNRTKPATISIEAITGTPASSPSAPVLTNNNVITDVPLADVPVPAGAPTISTGVVDRRQFCFAKTGMPAGTVVSTLATAAPEGFAFAIGQTLQSSDYPALARAMGITASTITLPDMRNRTIRGASFTSGSPGQTSGADSVTLSVPNLPSHAHTLNDPQHQHSIPQSPHTHGVTQTPHEHAMDGDFGNRFVVTASGNQNQGLTGPQLNGVTFSDIDANNAIVSIDAANANVPATEFNYAGISMNNTGSGQAFSVVPSYTAVNFMVKVH